MKQIVFTLIALTSLLIGQNYQQDNGDALGTYSNGNFDMWEETCYLQPDAPGILDTIYVFLDGSTPRIDTIRVINDASDGEYPSSWWVSGLATYNTFVEFQFQYNEPGWYAFDVSAFDLEIGGLNRVGVQHIIKSGGPYFVIDADGQDPVNSFLNDVFTPNTNFFNIRGTLMQATQGDYFVRAKIDWEYEEGNEADQPQAKLVDVTKEVGLTKDGNLFGANEAAIIDYNNDGFDDISVGGELFINNGNGGFDAIDVGLSGSKFAWADLDNDGYLDAYSSTGNSNDKIFWGGEDGMTEMTPEIFKQDLPTMSPLFFDMDLDGDLDIYIAHNRRTVDGQEVFYRDQLYRNDGNREFTNITEGSEIAVNGELSPKDCYGANIVDFNNDGFPDIFVATYRLAPDQLYVNDGSGRFFESAEALGVIGNETFNPDLFGHGMGSDWGDYNNDGFVDLAVGNLGHPDERGAVSNPSLVFTNQGDDSFIENHKELGIRFYEMNSGVTWVDLNNDGWLDLWHNQYSYQRINERPNNYSRVYINSGETNNFRFVDRTWDLGAMIHGSWTAQRIDFDNDGDYDLLVCSSQENIKLFRNDLSDGNYLKIRLKGEPDKGVNLNAYGSSIKVKTEKGEYTKQLMGTQNHGRTSQSSDDIIFGLGEASTIEYAEVTFSDGSTQRVDNPKINSTIMISLEEDKELSKPEPIFPANGEIADVEGFTFNWQNLPTSDEYILQVSKNPDFSELVIESTIEGENNSHYSVKLPEGNYYWRLQGNNSISESPWTSPTAFEVGEITSVDISLEVLDVNIYPNPASNEIVNINFTLEQSSDIDIELFDILGNKIKDLHNGYESLGPKKFSFISQTLQAGSYFIKINTPSGSITKKLTINK